MRFLFSRQYILLLSCLAVFGVAVLVPNVALAQLGFLGGIADAIGDKIGAIIAGFLLSIPSAILAIASFQLSQAIDPFYIRLSYTTGPAVDAGWVVVRDLANMLIVFFLIIIGLGTALRLGQYEASKTLPKLIGVALLINFTPVITGFIVDVSNIFMNFFLEGVAGAGILNTIFTSIASGLSNDVPEFFDPAGGVGFILKILLIGIFEIFAAIVFFLFAALFIVRRIAIWILVILSPIAFVASVLPGTAGLFKMWWSQFFQWSIIGIFAAFFLWLGDQIISIAGQGTLVAQAPPENFVADMMNEVMPFGIALAMLLVGFFVALQASGAMGAGVTKTFAMKGLAWSGATVGSSLWRRYGDKPTNLVEKIVGGGSKMQQWGSERRGLGAVIGAPAVGLGWGIKNIGKAATSGVQELTKQTRFRDTAALNNAEKEVEKMPAKEDVFATINTELLKPVPNKNRILGLWNGLIKRGDGNDLENAFKPGGALAGKHAMVGQLAKMGGSRFGPHGERPILKAFYGSIFNDPAKFGFNIKDEDLEVEKDAAGNIVLGADKKPIQKRDGAGRVVFKDIEKDVLGKTVVGEDERPVLKADARKGSDAQYLELQKTKIPARMASTDFEKDVTAPSNYDPSTPEGQIFIQSMMAGRGAEFIGQIIRRREKEHRQAIIEFLDRIDEKWFLENDAEDVLKWFTSTGARNLGLSRIDPSTGEPMTQGGFQRLAQEKINQSLEAIGKQVTELQRSPRASSTEIVEQIRKLEEERKRQETRRDRIRMASESRRGGATSSSSSSPTSPPSTSPPPTTGTPPTGGTPSP